MENEIGGPGPTPAKFDSNHATPACDPSSDMRKKPSIKVPSTTSSPLSSAPTTPAPTLTTDRRASHPAVLPLHQTSPRPPSSPRLAKKSSRSSLSGQPDDVERRPTPKRSISNLIAGLRESHSSMKAIEEPVPLTAPQVAIEHFTRELLAHAQQDPSSETVVVLHDACYGHRYSRLKATKSTLSMIVERPERILASALGVSAAYVRLGGHHSGAQNAPHPDITQAATPPFRIRRTRRTMDIMSSCVTNVHGTEWMSELRDMCEMAGTKLATGAKELSRSSTPVDPEKPSLHENDLYLCSESLNAFEGALGGVIEAVDTVFTPSSDTSRAFVAIRPPGHHCSADYPSGFCWLNNVHVGIEYAAQTHGLTHVAIIDFDLHHGDGSQTIAWERNSQNNTKRLHAKANSKLKLGPDIGYYSVHDINSYPCESGEDDKVQAASLCIENAHGQNLWNVHLQPWKTIDEFWHLYETRYKVLLEKARDFLRNHTNRLKADRKVHPEAAIFISAGFDASEWEGEGMQRHKVNVPTEFYARFTRDIVALANDGDTCCRGRVISVLEGGYSDRALCSGVLSHLSGLSGKPKREQSLNSQTEPTPLDHMMSGLVIDGSTNSLQYNTAWWSPANLTALELKVNPPPPPQGKKVRTGPQPTYATPTESFAYKVVDANKFARSISGTMRESPKPARPPTPPAPEVDWIVATQELSRLLVPIDRQTKSCTAEDLGGVRVKKDRQSAVPILTTEESSRPRQLRDRKAKAPAYSESASTHSDDLESLRSVSRNSRRQTIADLPGAESLPEPSTQRRTSRRLSAASTTGLINDTPEPQTSAAPDQHSRLPVVPASGQHTAPKVGASLKKVRSLPKSTKTTEPPSRGVALQSNNTASASNANEQLDVAFASSNDGVDSLTTGMKKITLKVGSREDHDRKQRERVDAERRARGFKAAETRKANAAARKAAKESEPLNGVQAEKTLLQRPSETSSTKAKVPAPQATASIHEPLPPDVVPPAFQGASAENTAVTGPSAEALPVSEELQSNTVMFTPGIPTSPMPSSGNQPDLNGESTTMARMTGHGTPHVSTDTNLVPSVENDASVEHDPFQTSQQVTQPDSTLPQKISPIETASYPQHPAMPEFQPMSKDQMPIWSSTGTVPFASTAGAASSQSQWKENVPLSSFAPDEHRPPQSENPYQAWDATTQKADPVQTVQLPSKLTADESSSVWDVPETPRQ